MGPITLLILTLDICKYRSDLRQEMCCEVFFTLHGVHFTSGTRYLVPVQEFVSFPSVSVRTSRSTGTEGLVVGSRVAVRVGHEEGEVKLLGHVRLSNESLVGTPHV